MDELGPYDIALLAAAGEGKRILVRELLRAGANEDATDYYGFTPLILAAQGGFVV